jgi:hypothetical protein
MALSNNERKLKKSYGWLRNEPSKFEKMTLNTFLLSLNCEINILEN